MAADRSRIEYSLISPLPWSCRENFFSGRYTLLGKLVVSSRSLQGILVGNFWKGSVCSSRCSPSTSVAVRSSVVGLKREDCRQQQEGSIVFCRPNRRIRISRQESQHSFPGSISILASRARRVMCPSRLPLWARQRSYKPRPLAGQEPTSRGTSRGQDQMSCEIYHEKPRL